MTEEQKRKNTAYKNRYNMENYDRIALIVPKGLKQVIKAHANAKGETSINAYINALIQADIKGT